ncbi:hypothetical protein QYF61_003850 [Mycteria americana]|uniref:Rna-directed dna polymerase from mobile element jockey-like n=1 Tax=Mycteria americana TaxID=33587 RepID=A0AAN7NKE4_MYCAM|nr:hypothetical protein QYF61_003850 [Mycteria americana]
MLMYVTVKPHACFLLHELDSLAGVRLRNALQSSNCHDASCQCRQHGDYSALLFYFSPLFMPSPIPTLTISPDTLPSLTAPAEVSLCLVQIEDLGKVTGFILTNKERLIWDMNVRGRLDCSDHKVVEYRILKRGSRAKSRITTWTSGFLQQREDQGKCRPGTEWGRGPGEKGMEKAKVLNALFTSLFTGKTCFQESQGLDIRGKVWSMEDLPFVGKDQVREFKANIYKSMGPDRMHPQVLRELANVMAVGEVPVDWEKANITTTFNKGKKEELGNYNLVILTSDPGKVMEQVILETIAKHMKGKKGWMCGKHGVERFIRAGQEPGRVQM